eukprot:scaffold649_cov347-Pavlova_lutheri.AAC.133
MAMAKNSRTKGTKKDAKGEKGGAGAGMDRMLEQTLRKLKKDNQSLRNEAKGLSEELVHVKEEMESMKNVVNIHSEHAESIVRYGEEREQEAEDRYEECKDQLTKARTELDLTKHALAEEKRSSDALKEKIEQMSILYDEKTRLEDRIEGQDVQIRQLEGDLKTFKEKAAGLENEKDVMLDENGQYRYSVRSGSQLKMIHQSPWYFKKKCYKICTTSTVRLEGGTVASTGQSTLILLGMSASRAEDHVISLTRNQLCGFKLSRVERSDFPGRCYHTCNYISNVGLVVFGGRNSDLVSDKLLVFDGKGGKWTSMPDFHSDVPSLECHCSVSFGSNLFVYGGVLADGKLNGELYVLDLEKQKGSGLTPATLTTPKPRKKSALAVTDDGLMLWMFGGQHGESVLDDLYTFDLEKKKWEQQVEHSGLRPQGRAGHVCRYSQGFILLSGGYSMSPASGRVCLLDTWVLDTGMMKWYKVDDGSFLWQSPAGALQGQQLSYTHSFDTRGCLNIVGNDCDGNIDSLITLDVLFGDGLENDLDDQGDETRSSRLEFLDKCEAGATQIELAWRPPERNADRIEHFKLMVANNLGVVKEVYRGKSMHFRVRKLRPSTEYIFCLKAVYADGSYLWSDPKSFKTRHGEKE